jgi:hypothetical protein
MFNAFEATTRLKGKPGANSTAGVAKTSTVTARSKSELRELGERMGWTPRKMTMAEVRKLSSQEFLWREQFDAENLNAALELPAKLAEGREIDKQWGAKHFWDKYWNTQNHASPEEAKQTLVLLDQFTSAYPQFIASKPENQVVLEWLKDRHKELTFANLRDSFEANAFAGKLRLNPSAINAGSETEVSGQDLLRHRNFHLLLQPHKRGSDLERMSADEYFEENNDVLGDKRVPPLVAARNAKTEATAQHFQHAAEHTSKANVVTVTDFPQQSHGVPPQPDKVSFRKKVQSMSADDIRRECDIDPSFKDALDQL